MAQVDHLVVLATSLDEGVAWCEATLGVTPSPGGEHPLMGTHNRLINVASPQFPQAYLEIIAINSEATSARQSSQNRWFDMDNPVLQAQVAQAGPQLIHFVASVTDAHTAVAAWEQLDIDPGPVLPLSRMTPSGLLAWQITVRDDGQRLFDGCLPTLIQWGTAHPIHKLPVSGVALHSLQAHHPEASALGQAYAAIGLSNVPVEAMAPGGKARLRAQLHTPQGEVWLESGRLAAADR